MIEAVVPSPQLPAPELPPAPYRGIEPFRYIDQPIFCAREAETRKLVRSTTIYRGVLLYGASGSGKSSLINAGLIPELVGEGFFCERIRVQPRRGEELIIERIPLTHGGGPPYLPSFFEEEYDRGAVGGFLEKVMPSFFGDGEAEARIVYSVTGFLARLRENARDRSVLLIFDQFEEFVTLFEEAPQVQSLQEAKEIQNAILDALVKLLRNQALPVKLLFSFREDYLARLSVLFRQCPDLTDQYLRLTPPDKKALLDIVRGPFKSERAREHFGREMSEEIVQDLAAEIEKRNDSDLLNLSEVEIVCDRLWHAEDPLQSLKKRGVQGLLEDYLSEELVRLKDLRDPAVALLGRMVTSAGTRNVISEADLLEQVRKEERLSEEILKTALSALEKDTRLVQRERRNKVYVYEIVSEFLVPWIFRQKELREAERTRQALWRKAFAVVAVILLAGAAAWYWYDQRNSFEYLSRALERTKAQLSAIERELEARESELQKRHTDVERLERLLRESRSESTGLQQDLTSLRGEYGAVTGRLDTARREFERSREEGRRLQQEVETRDGLLRQAAREKSDLEAQIQQLQRDLAEQRQVAQRTSGELQEERERTRRLTESLGTKTAEAEALARTLDGERRSSQERIERLTGERNAANVAASSCRNEKAALVRDKERAEADAQRVREDLEICQTSSRMPVGPP